MRVAAVGIFCAPDEKNYNLEQIFNLAVRDAKITHGNIWAHEGGGFIASVVAQGIRGEDFNKSVENALGLVRNAEFKNLLISGLNSNEKVQITENLGGGWIASEAVAIALFCSKKHFNNGLNILDTLKLATRHHGDSDFTGEITGNLIGRLHR